MKNTSISFRTSYEEKRQIRSNAKREGLTVTAYLLLKALNPKRYTIFADKVVLEGDICLEKK